MKRVKIFMTVIILSFSFIQLAKAQGGVETFVKMKDNLVCRMLIDLYDPGSELMNVRVDLQRIPKDSLDTSLRIGTDNGVLFISLWWVKDHFYDISCFEHDEVKVSAEKLKALANNLTKDFKKDEIAFVKRKWGKSLHELNIKELYCAVFTIRFWRMDYHEYSGR